MQNLNILYEDNHIIVVIKPQGIMSQSDGKGLEDMLTIVKEYIKERYNKPGNVYLGLVHRLDTMTSGIMVFAKTSKAASRLSKNIREGDFKKKYIAVVEGNMQLNKKGTLENYLIKNGKTNLSKVVSENTKDAKYAKLNYEVIKNTRLKDIDVSVVKVELLTGRHHQIRAQFANINHPLLGDIKYGAKKGTLMLFAYSLDFIHPTKDEYMHFEYIPNIGNWKGLELNCI